MVCELIFANHYFYFAKMINIIIFAYLNKQKIICMIENDNSLEKAVDSLIETTNICINNINNNNIVKMLELRNFLVDVVGEQEHEDKNFDKLLQKHYGQNHTEKSC